MISTSAKWSSKFKAGIITSLLSVYFIIYRYNSVLFSLDKQRREFFVQNAGISTARWETRHHSDRLWTDFSSASEAEEKLKFYFDKKFRYSVDKGFKPRIPDRFRRFQLLYSNSSLPKLAKSTANKRCEKDTELIVVVNSAAANFDNRQAIRATWGNKTTPDFQSMKVEVFFVVGRFGVEQGSWDIRLDEEAGIYGDLIIGEFVDDYRNLTVKTLLGMKWAVNACGSAKYLLHADDDVYLKLSEIYLDFLPLDDNRDTIVNAVTCGHKMQKWAKITRRGKWGSSFEKYNTVYYPPYCTGPCYSVPLEGARVMYEASKYTPRDVTVDDVVVTGILREKVGLQLKMMVRNRCKLLHESKDIMSTMNEMWNNRENQP